MSRRSVTSRRSGRSGRSRRSGRSPGRWRLIWWDVLVDGVGHPGLADIESEYRVSFANIR